MNEKYDPHREILFQSGNTVAVKCAGESTGFELAVNGEWMLADVSGTQDAQFGNVPFLLENGQRVPAETAPETLLWKESWQGVQIAAWDMTEHWSTLAEKAVRVWIGVFPHQMLTADLVVTRRPAQLGTQFCFDNKDGALQEHHYSDQRLVLRRHGQALKLFELLSSVDGVPVQAAYSGAWIALPEEEQTVRRYCWQDTRGTEHIRVHTYLMDTSEQVVRWHAYAIDDGFVRLEDPEGRCLDVKAECACITLRNDQQSKRFSL